MLVMVLDDALIKIGTFLLTLASLCLTVFFVLLSAKIGEEESDIQQWYYRALLIRLTNSIFRRWFAVFSPLWAMHLLLIISGIVFLAVCCPVFGSMLCLRVAHSFLIRYSLMSHSCQMTWHVAKTRVWNCLLSNLGTGSTSSCSLLPCSISPLLLYVSPISC